LCKDTCVSPSAPGHYAGSLSRELVRPRQTLTAHAEIAIARRRDLSSRIASRPRPGQGGDHIDAPVRSYSAVIKLTLPLAQVSHSSPPLGDATIWIGAAVLSGVLGNLAYDVVRRGIGRVIAKLRRSCTKR
jgi:hypothetical protein